LKVEISIEFNFQIGHVCTFLFSVAESKCIFILAHSNDCFRVRSKYLRRM